MRRDVLARWVYAGAALSLLTSLTLPLWYTRMEAPQYKGDEALEVHVYASGIRGDLQYHKGNVRCRQWGM